MAKVKKALMSRLDPHFSIERRTQERYKIATLKIIECDDKSFNGKNATLYINKYINKEMIMSLQKNIYWHNFIVNKSGCCNHFVDSKNVPDDFYCSIDGTEPRTDQIAKALTAGEEFLGVEFSKALQKVFEVRMSRYSQYGDTYLEDSYDSLINQVKDKMKRVDLNIQSGGANYENSSDSVIDAINYSIFILAKIIKGKQ